ncbi:phosphotransferase [Microbacterium gilvum]|uniref:Aminoglycoside phosphotransferase domain-containing protein n=1 Tax=Microbacterium gilvum TaxID=1336204 RepID=A0ABP9A622_9MICO
MRDGDAALVARDEALPALADVLDAGRLRRVLAARRVEIGYLRYKPATSAVAGIRVDGRAAQAVAYPVGVHGKLARLATETGDDLLLLDDARGLAVVAAPGDRALPGIRTALARHPRAETLVYKPGRRWVGRCVECGVIAKAHAASRAARALRGHDAVAAFLPTAPITHRGVDGLVEYRLLPGTALLHLASGAVAVEAARATGAVLARLHASPAPDGAPSVAGEPIAAGAGDVLPGLSTRMARLSAETATLLAGRAVTAPAHGDFSADQVIVGAGGVHVIDLDRAGVGDPMADLGSWTADEIARGIPRSAAGTALREGYEAAGGRIDGTALIAHTAAALLRRSVEPFRQRAVDWPSRCAALADEAEAFLALARVRRDDALPGRGRADADTSVVAHRPGRRAVIRTSDGYVKLVRPSRFAGVADRAERVSGLRSLEAPTVLERDDDTATLRLSGVGDRTLLDAGPALPMPVVREVWRRVGRGLAELHDLDPAGLPRHGADDELAAIRRAVDPAVAAGLLDTARVAAALAAAEDGLRAAPGPLGVLHRDLHDKQLLLPAGRVTAAGVAAGRERVGVIDVDTMAVGERALDIANLLVHLDLRVAQGLLDTGRAGEAGQALRDGVGEGPVWGRVPAYAAATRLRLAGVYAVRDGWRGVAEAMLAAVADG